MNVVFRMFNKRQIDFFYSNRGYWWSLSFSIDWRIGHFSFLLFLVAGVSVMEGEGSAAEGGEQAVVVAKLDPGQGEVTSELINSGLDWSAGLRLSKTGVDGVGWLLTPEKADPGLMGDRVRSSGEAGW